VGSANHGADTADLKAVSDVMIALEKRLEQREAQIETLRAGQRGLVPA
jgi:hypothetical protein